MTGVFSKMVANGTWPAQAVSDEQPKTYYPSWLRHQVGQICREHGTRRVECYTAVEKLEDIKVATKQALSKPSNPMSCNTAALVSDPSWLPIVPWSVVPGCNMNNFHRLSNLISLISMYCVMTAANIGAALDISMIWRVVVVARQVKRAKQADSADDVQNNS